MDYEDDFDFAVIAENLFLKDDTDVNFIFAVTWKHKSSKLVINCREFHKRSNHSQGAARIKSFTITEFEAIHNELCSIEPKIKPYFPNDFSFKVINIERVNNSSWNFFSLGSISIVEQEKELSDETAEAIKTYLRAVAEICGQKLLFNVIFKEDNDTYFEDHDLFIKKESKKKIRQCENDCCKLLDSHDDFGNLQTLTENLYLKEDATFRSYQDSLFNDSLVLTLPLTEESENTKERLEKLLTDIQISGIGPKMITELKLEVEKCLQQYYECSKEILHIKIKLAKRQKAMYFKYLTKMIEDKNKYQAIIFRDCAGQRMSQLSEDFHKENEKLSQLYLDLHSTKDIVILRKIELVRSWREGEEMVRPNVRHEDASLIQLKNLDRSNIELSVLEEYYSYISETYKLLLDYNESQRLRFDNKKHVLDDPLGVILPTTLRFQSNLQTKVDKKDSLQSIDYYGLMNSDIDSDFEDALGEDEFVTLKKTETEKIKLRDECENKLKEIAHKKAGLRNSKARLDIQYEKLIKKATEITERNDESLNLESLHPEKQKKRTSGTSLTAELRKQEARKARERIKQYQEKLKVIPENKIMKSIKPKRNESGKENLTIGSSKLDKDLVSQGSIQIPQSKIPPQVILPPPHPPPHPPPPPPPPPPINIPQPPPPSLPPTIILKSNIPEKSSERKNMSYIDELQMAFSKRKVARTSSTIDEEVLSRKSKNSSQIAGSLSSVVDSRRRFFNSED